MPETFAYDVFLSHSSRDKPIVRPIAERLKADGLRVASTCQRLPGEIPFHPMLPERVK